MVTNPNYPFNYIKTHNFVDNAVTNGPNEFFNFDEQSLRLLFFNDIYKPLRWPHKSIPGTEESVGNVLSRVNNEGFRSDDFNTETEIVISGCSQTYGMGIPERYIWPELVKGRFDKSVSNLGQPGASWSMIVNNLFAYFKKYGHPKVVVVIFPNTERIQIPVNLQFFVTEYFGNRDKEIELATWPTLGDEYLQVSYPGQFPGPKYSKHPHVAKEVLSKDFVYFLCMQSVNILEQYCEAVGIKLVWSTWDFMTGRSIEKMKSIDSSYFKGYFDLKMDYWCHPVQQYPDNYHGSILQNNDNCLKEEPCDKIIYCHEELKQETMQFFDIALDNGHWGSHRHAHVAETVIEVINKIL